jgi:hypothetical protein
MNFVDLIGKTISAVTLMKKPAFDDVAWLQLSFTDDTSCVVAGTYGGFTGASEDEFPAYILISDSVAGLVPV